MASRSLGQLTLDMVLRTGNFSEPLKRAGRDTRREMKGIQSEAEKTGRLIRTALSAIGATALFTKFISETINAQNEQAQLAAVLRSTGQAAGYTQKQLNDMANSMSGRSIFSTGEINQAQTALLAFTGIVGEQFPAALQAASDMAARTGLSIQGAAETIGRALDVPSQGLASLSRQGFRFTQEQKDLVAQLERTGKTAEAQGIILKALNESYGGAAEAARNTFGGALIGLRNQINSLLTGEDGIHTATAAINSFTKALASPAALAALDGIKVSAAALAVLLGARLVSSVTASTVAFAAGRIESIRYQAALASMAGVSATTATALTAQAAAARAASGALMLVGGPVGAAVIAGTGLLYLSAQLSNTQSATKELVKDADDLYIKLANIEAFSKQRAAIRESANQIEDIKSSYEALGREIEELNKKQSPGRTLSVNIKDEKRRNELIEERKILSSQLAEAEKKLAAVVRDTNKDFNDPSRLNSTKKLTEGLRDPEIVKNIEKQVAALEAQADALGLSADMAALNKLELEGASRAELQRAEAALKEINEYNIAAEQRQKSMQEEIRLAEQRRGQLREEMAMRNELAVFARQRQFNVDAVGLGDRERQQQEEIFAIQEEFSRRRRELEERQRVESTRLDEETYKRSVQMLQNAENEKLRIQQDSTEKRAAAEQNWINGARRAYTNYTDDVRNHAVTAERFFTGAFNSMEDAVTQFALSGKLEFKSFATAIISDIARIAARAAATQILGFLVQAGAAYFGSSSSSPGASQSISNGGTGLYSEGGYTGAGGKYEPAGIVHRGEVVWSQNDVARAGGVGVVEALRKGLAGYANGGPVGLRNIPVDSLGSSTVISINAPVTIEGQQQQNNGQIDTAAMQRGIQDQMKRVVQEELQKAWRPGGTNYRAVRNM